MEEKRGFTTFDSITVLGLLGGVVVIIFSIVSNAMMDQRETEAKYRAKQLAAQILMGGYKASLVNDSQYGVPSRQIASIAKMDIRPVGRIGRDPWGSPYFYRAYTDGNNRLKVFVFSAGPNLVLDTVETYLTAESISDMPRIEFRGDDIGSLQTGI